MSITIKKSSEKRAVYIDEKGRPLAGRPLIQAVKENVGDTILLSFSGGKDSLATWLYLRDHFNIIPFFMWWCPGMKFPEASLDYFEAFFDTHIIRLPHPLFWQKLREEVFQPPERIGLIRAMRLPPFSFAELEGALADQLDLHPYVTACGMRAKDNINRRNLILQKGAVGTAKRKFFYPIWDWDINQVVDTIREHGAKVPAEYHIWGRTLAAWDYEYLKPMQRHYPEDYALLKEWLPLIDLELFRYEVVGKGRRHSRQGPATKRSAAA
jgi:3'-phosphoadenosine 5'-phosphosulfate sulfotransferase (PAPS reductase)/FAD synthetase